MRALYVDSSALVAILFEESGAKRVRKALQAADELVSSHLIEAELYSSAARERVSLDDAHSLIKHLSLFFPDRPLFEEYRQVSANRYVRGPDAHHLACALYLDPERRELGFVTLDKEQQKIALRLGFSSSAF